jgi:hypothetical protein
MMRIVPRLRDASAWTPGADVLQLSVGRLTEPIEAAGGVRTSRIRTILHGVDKLLRRAGVNKFLDEFFYTSNGGLAEHGAAQ